MIDKMKSALNIHHESIYVGEKETTSKDYENTQKVRNRKNTACTVQDSIAQEEDVIFQSQDF